MRMRVSSCRFAQVVARRRPRPRVLKVGGSPMRRSCGKHRKNQAGRRLIGSRQFTALASISDSVYLPAPLGPPGSANEKPVRPHRLAQVPHRRRIPRNCLKPWIECKGEDDQGSSYILPW